MEDEPSTFIKGSKKTMKFLENFSCFNCREIGNIPYLLACNHLYCENCVSNFNMRKNDGSLVCPYCYMTTKKSDLLSELEIKFLINDLKSIDDEEFSKRYENKINYIYDCSNKNSNKLRNILSALVKFSLLKHSNNKNNDNAKMEVYKRNYYEFKKETFLPNKENIYEATFQTKPTFKFS